MRQLLLTVCVFALLALVPQAQSATFKLQWDQAETPAVVADVVYALKVDAASPVVIVPACAVNGSGTRCVAVLPTLATGPHTLVLTASNAFGTVSSDPLSGGPPSKPINVTVVVTVSVP